MTVARRPARIRIGVLAGFVALLALVVAPAAPAHADETLTWVPSSLSAAYGTYFDLRVNDTRATNVCYSCPRNVVTVTYTGTSSGTITSRFAYDGNAYVGGGSWNPPLGTGTYHLVATADVTGDGTPATSAPMTLKITPAPATSEVRISADPLNARNAVINARLKAPIIDDFEHGDSYWGLPAGTWHLAAADSSGATAFSKDVVIAANTVAFANVLWQNVPPGNEFSVTATFKPSGTSGANFVVTAAPGVNFTTAAQPTPTPTSNPSQAPAAADLTGAPIPLWALILLGLLGLAALVLVVVAVLRRPTSTIPA